MKNTYQVLERRIKMNKTNKELLKQFIMKPKLPKVVKIGSVCGVTFITLRQPKWFEKMLTPVSNKETKE